MQSLSRVVCERGFKGISLSVGAPESPLSMGPERPCYATVAKFEFKVKVGLQL